MIFNDNCKVIKVKTYSHYIYNAIAIQPDAKTKTAIKAVITNTQYFLTCQKSSLLSEHEYDARYFPSGEKATALTVPLCAVSTCNINNNINNNNNTHICIVPYGRNFRGAVASECASESQKSEESKPGRKGMSSA